MKKLFGIMALAAIAATAGWNYSQSQDDVELSDLALANVEALASAEYPDIDGFNTWILYKTWDFDYSPPRLKTSCTSGGHSVCA